MSKPTFEEYLKSAATWKGEHCGMRYSLSHHGISDYSPEGTWCFYIHVFENMFLADDDFAKFDREPEAMESNGRHSENYRYEDVPDYGFHGGITFYERTTYMDKDGTRRKALKIGCDYAHSWDRDYGYSDGFREVEMDVKRMIEKLVEAHPLKTKCCYSGILGKPEEFYKSRHGGMVHNSQLVNFSEDKWPTWLPEVSALSLAREV